MSKANNSCNQLIHKEIKFRKPDFTGFLHLASTIRLYRSDTSSGGGALNLHAPLC